jgi:hypothetical protein
MGTYLLVSTCIIYAVVIMSLVTRHYRVATGQSARVMSLDPRHYRAGMGQPTPISDVLWIGTLWGVTLGTAMYINRTLPFFNSPAQTLLNVAFDPALTLFNPPMYLNDKLLYWILGLLGSLTVLGTLFGVQPMRKKFLTLVLGGLCAWLVLVVLSSLGGNLEIGGYGGISVVQPVICEGC